MVCHEEVLFQSVNTLPAEHETSNASVVIWSVERSTPSTTERNTAPSERVLTRLVVHSAFPDSRLYRAKKRVLLTIHAWIVPSCVVVARVYTHNLFTHMSPHFAHGSGAEWLLNSDPR